MAPIKYKTGDKINGYLFLNEISYTKSRMGTFKCMCGKVFNAKLSIIIARVGKCCCSVNVVPRDSENNPISEYSIWRNMKARCNNVNNHKFKNYGARGIKVCDRWLNSFSSFIEDMGMKPTPKHSIERIDNNKGYSPENCKWATNSEQQNNTTRTFKINVNGEVMGATALARKLGINRKKITRRFDKINTEKHLGIEHYKLIPRQ